MSRGASLGRTPVLPADAEPVLSRYEAAWRQGTPPALVEFLPPEGEADTSRLARRALLEELVKIDLEYRWRTAGQRPTLLSGAVSANPNEPLPGRPLLEDYATSFPELGPRERLSVDLIGEEYWVRHCWGDQPGHAEYLARFPAQAGTLADSLTHLDAELSAWDHSTGADRGGTMMVPVTQVVGQAELPIVPGYELLGELGRGGMGVVYKAQQVGLKRLVALKMILSGAQASPGELARFKAEAEAVARLQHPNIVQVHDVGECDGRPYFSLEYVDGGSLAQQLAGKPVPASTAAALLQTLARAVHAAHQAGVVHRDLKPANVLLAFGLHAEGSAWDVLLSGSRLHAATPKIADFGLAKRLDGAAGQTHSGAVMGTPSYMAPEQAAGKAKAVGPPADVYALGAILYEMLTGRPPFKGETVMDTLAMVIAQDPVPPSRLVPRLPRDLETICLKCLEKETGRRYPTAEELAEDLQRFLNGDPVRARPVSPLRRGLRAVRRRPLRALALFAVLLLTGLAGVGAWYWDAHYRLKVAYFANYVERWGNPVGVGRLSEEQARRRYWTFKFFHRGDNVEKIEAVNGQGQLTTRFERATWLQSHAELDQEKRRECAYAYKRNAQGELTEVAATDRMGEIVWVLHYTTRTTAHYTDQRGYPRSRSDSGAAYVEFVWSDEGFARETRYFDRNGQPQPNQHGDLGVRQEFDERGFVVQETILGLDGKPMVGKGGFAMWEAAYDTLGNLTEVGFLGLDGQPALDRTTQCFRQTKKYDEVGNMIELAYRDAAGNPMRYKGGYARATLSYDLHGNPVAVAYFDPQGRPTPDSSGVPRWVAKHDERGNIVEVARFGTDGQPALNKKGVCRMTMQYDDRGNRVAVAYFDVAGNPTLDKNGVAQIVMQYDDRGNRVEWVYLDVEGKPAIHRDGGAMQTARYDDFRNRIEVAHYDRHGKPTLCKEGYARLTQQFDVSGNRVEQACFDEQGRPTRNNEGVARQTMKYDARGNQIEWAVFGPDGEPALVKGGWYSRRKMKYDARDNLIDTINLGVDGDLTLDSNGVARYANKYDDSGNRTEEAYFGVDGKPTVAATGAARLLKQYDDRGNPTEWAYFGRDGKPTRIQSGFARRTLKYDDRGNGIEETYFDDYGKLTLHRNGYAGHRRKFDDRGQDIEWAYFGLDGKPMVTTLGYVINRVGWDERGNEVERTYFGLDGQPVVHRNGFARSTRKYDERDNLIEEAFWGLDGRLARHREGYAKVLRKFDNRGNCTDEDYLGPDEKPTLSSLGVARVVAQFDERGNRVVRAFFGTDGQPVLNGFGVARVTFRYDARGQQIEWAIFGTDGHPVLNPTGFARKTLAYDPRGNCIEEAFFGLDGKLTQAVLGYARLTRPCDERGNAVEVHYFDVEGEPVQTRPVITDIDRGSKAAKVGLRIGDVILSYDAKPMRSVAEFRTVKLAELVDNKLRELCIWREGKRMTLQVPSGVLGFTFEDHGVSRNVPDS